MKKLTPNEIEAVKAYINKAKYDPSGQMIFRFNEKKGLGALVDVRGWGAIQHMFKTEDEAAAFQDTVGQFITDAINTALSTITLDQPKIDLNEVELCVLYIAERKGKLYPEPAEVWGNKLRKAIGYTLSDLGTSGNNGI